MPLRWSFADRARMLIFYLLVAAQITFACFATRSNEMVTTTTMAPKTCKTGYTFFAATGFCYKAVLVSAGITEAAAEATCAANGGNLASIHSAAENAFVYSLIIGAGAVEESSQTCAGPDSGFWIGITIPNPAKGTTNVDWIDGTPFDYTDWGPNQPDDFCGGEMCGYIEVTDGAFSGYNTKWNDAPCALLATGYVCEQPPS